MAEFGELFGDAMRALEAEGLDFSSHAKQTLTEVLGLTAAEPFLFLLGKEAFRDPRLFSERASRFLGGGSYSLCKVIASRAIEEIRGSRHLPAVKAFESNVPHFGLPSTAGPEGRKPTHLHDHRTKDQLDAYADES